MAESTSSISRRRFAQLFGAGTAIAVVAPRLAAAKQLLAHESEAYRDAAPTLVRLSSNENPYGPSPLAVAAMTKAFSLAWRYPDEHADQLVEKLARMHGVESEQILLGDGSGEILKLSATAFTGPAPEKNATANSAKRGQGKLVVADPTFEAILNHARISGAEVVKVPLTKDYAHDLATMLETASQGLIYVCNPNNPTASLTPKKELRDFIARAPRDTMILVDEAYHHYVDSPDYESVIPLIKSYPNLLVARTFSKIYGMAGLRCGYCIAQKEAIQRMRPHQTWDSVNIMALVAASASLEDADQVQHGRRRNSETRAFLLRELDTMGYRYTPSQANFIMIDLKRPVLPIIGALANQSVQVGRLFPTLPNHLRVTVGTRPDIEAFLAAFRRVMS